MIEPKTVFKNYTSGIVFEQYETTNVSKVDSHCGVYNLFVQAEDATY